MLRNAVSVTLCLMLSVSSALAEPPLPPGKPAGIKHAQDVNYGAIGIGALVLIAVAGYAISAQPYQIPGTPTVTAATSTQP